MKINLIIAGVFALVAWCVVWKLPAVVDAAFIISAATAGFFVSKKNSKDAVDKITK